MTATDARILARLNGERTQREHWVHIALGVVGGVLILRALIGWATDPTEWSCTVVAPPADYVTETQRQWVWSLDYANGAWVDPDGRIVGYSEHEDSTIWNKKGCGL